MEYFLKLFLSGTAKGSIYALIALGYTMVYGIIQLINFAHGEIYMIGGFTALILGGFFFSNGMPVGFVLLFSVLLSIMYAAAFGFTVEKIAYRPLRGKPRLSALISAIGVSMVLQNFVLLSQTEKFLSFPSYLPEFNWLQPYKAYINSTQLIILGVTAIIMVLLTLLIKFTRIGKAMRATAQDMHMAQLVGVDVNQVISVTFIIDRSTTTSGSSQASRPSWPQSSAALGASPAPYSAALCSAGQRASALGISPATTRTPSHSSSSSSSFSSSPMAFSAEPRDRRYKL